jgi:hypothetical protein
MHHRIQEHKPWLACQPAYKLHSLTSQASTFSKSYHDHQASLICICRGTLGIHRLCRLFSLPLDIYSHSAFCQSYTTLTSSEHVHQNSKTHDTCTTTLEHLRSGLQPLPNMAGGLPSASAKSSSLGSAGIRRFARAINAPYRLRP